MAIIFPPGNDGDKYTASNGIIYEFSDGAWRLAAGNVKAGVHIGTTPPNNPQAGDLWWHSGEADLKIYYIDPSSEQWVPASSPPDPYEENFVSITGDTMTGTLIMQKSGIRYDKEDLSRHLTISPNAGDYFTNIFSHNCNGAENSLGKRGGIRFRVAPKNGTDDYKTTIISEWNPHSVGGEDHNVRSTIAFLQNPGKPHHAVNKSYVDEAVAAVATGDGRPAGMPGTRYKYSDSSGSSMPDGTFHIGGSGEVYLSRISFDGVEMSSYQKDDFSSSVRYMCHVRGSDGRVLHSIVSSHWYQGEGTNQHIKHAVSTRIRDGKGEMVAGQIYYVTDGIFNF